MGEARFCGLAMTTTASLLAQQIDYPQSQPSVMADEKAEVAPTTKPVNSKRAQ
jgi:hypothetical protein